MKKMEVFRIYAIYLLMAAMFILIAIYGYYLIFGSPPGSFGQQIIVALAFLIGAVRPILIINEKKKLDTADESDGS